LQLWQGSNIDRDHGRETADITFYAGLRLWQGAELRVNPEIDQGFGLSGTLGVAGFPSGETYKVGSSLPYTQIAADLGVFARAGVASGNVEPYEFTDIDRTIAAGLSLNGKRWGRPDDTFGLTGVVNGISEQHQFISNPAYNRDRGPVSVIDGRLRAQF